jgi:hypothetical protein
VKCAASGPSEPQVHCSPEAKILEIQGLCVDKVLSISKFANVLESLRPYFNEVNEMVDSLTHYHGICPLSDMKWKVPIADASFPEVVFSTAVDLHSSYRAYALVLNVYIHTLLD